MLNIRAAQNGKALACWIEEAIAPQPRDPFVPLTWIVPHRAWGQSMLESAMVRSGVAAHVNMLLPQEHLNRCFQEWAAEDPSRPQLPLTISSLAWLIFERLNEERSSAARGPFERYLRPEGLTQDGCTSDPLRLLKLSFALATHLTQTLQQRPQKVAGWMSGVTSDSEIEVAYAALWRDLSQHPLFQKRWNPLKDRNAFLESLARQNPSSETVWVFQAEPWAPALHSFYEVLSQRSKVELIFLAPSLLEKPSAEVAWSRLDRLFAQGREISKAWVARGYEPKPMASQALDQPDASPPVSTLHAMQQHWEGPRGASPCYDPEDKSLQLKLSPSRFQEVLQLHQSLSQAIAADPTLQYRECLIVVPSIRDYGPFLRSIFNDPSATLPIHLPRHNAFDLAPPDAALLNLMIFFEEGEESEIFPLLFSDPLLLKHWQLTAEEGQKLSQCWADFRSDWTPVMAAWRSKMDGSKPLVPGELWLKLLMHRLWVVRGGIEETKGLRERAPLSQQESFSLSQGFKMGVEWHRWGLIWQEEASGRDWGRRLKKLVHLYFEGEAARRLKGALEAWQAEELEALTLKLPGKCLIERWRMRSTPSKSWRPKWGQNKIVCGEPSEVRGLSFRWIAVCGINEGRYPSAPPPSLLDLTEEPSQASRALQSADASLLEFGLLAKDNLHLSGLYGQDQRGSLLQPSIAWMEMMSPLYPPGAQAREAFFGLIAPQEDAPLSLALISPQNLQPRSTLTAPSPPPLAPSPMNWVQLSQCFEYPISAWHRARGWFNPAEPTILPLSHRQKDAKWGWLRRKKIFDLLFLNAKALEANALRPQLELEGFLPEDDWGESKLNDEMDALRQGWPDPSEMLAAISSERFTAVKLSSGWVYGALKEPHQGRVIEFFPGNWTARRCFRLWVHHLMLHASGQTCNTEGRGERSMALALTPLSEEAACWALNKLLEEAQQGEGVAPIPMVLESAWCWMEAYASAVSWIDRKGVREGRQALQKQIEGLLSVEDEDQRLKRARNEGWKAFYLKWLGAPYLPGERRQAGPEIEIRLMEQSRLELEKRWIPLLLPLWIYGARS